MASGLIIAGFNYYKMRKFKIINHFIKLNKINKLPFVDKFINLMYLIQKVQYFFQLIIP